jgi:hypothetical protein
VHGAGVFFVAVGFVVRFVTPNAVEPSFVIVGLGMVVAASWCS